jgi:hypothetical protein
MQNLIYKKKLDKFFFKWFIIITVASSVIAIIQEVVWVTTGTMLIGPIEERQIRFTMEQTSYGQLLRTPAFAPGYKLLAFYLISAILLILNYLFYKKDVEKRTKRYLFVSLCLLFTALLLTFSKDSLLALGIGVCLSILIRWPKYSIHITVAAAAVVLLVYLTPLWDYALKEVATEFSWGEYRMRVQLAREGINGFLHGYTFLGSGLKKAKMYTSHFLGWPAHSSIILSANEVGIFGLLAYLTAVGYTIERLVSINLPASNQNFMVARGMLIAIISLFILFQSHVGWLETILWMLMGTAQGMVLINRDEASGAQANV